MASADMEAINTYMINTQAQTSKAIKLKDDWIAWYDGLGFYALDLDGATYDEARNRRNAFNLANTVTSQERAAVKQGIAKGLTTEEMNGQARRLNSDGKFPEQTQPLIPTSYKVAAAAGGAATVVLIIFARLKKLISF